MIVKTIENGLKIAFCFSSFLDMQLQPWWLKSFSCFKLRVKKNKTQLLSLKAAHKYFKSWISCNFESHLYITNINPKKRFERVCLTWHLQVTRLTINFPNLCSKVYCFITDCLSTYAWIWFQLYTRCSLTSSLAVHQVKSLIATSSSPIISHPLVGTQRRHAAIFDKKYLQAVIGRGFSISTRHSPILGKSCGS